MTDIKPGLDALHRPQPHHQKHINCYTITIKVFTYFMTLSVLNLFIRTHPQNSPSSRWTASQSSRKITATRSYIPPMVPPHAQSPHVLRQLWPSYQLFVDSEWQYSSHYNRNSCLSASRHYSANFQSFLISFSNEGHRRRCQHDLQTIIRD